MDDTTQAEMAEDTPLLIEIDPVESVRAQLKAEAMETTGNVATTRAE